MLIMHTDYCILIINGWYLYKHLLNNISDYYFLLKLKETNWQLSIDSNMKFSTLMFVFIFYFIMHIFSTAALFHSTYIAVVEAIAKNLILKSNFFVKSKSLLAT